MKSEKKELDSLNSKELGELFPIIIDKPNPEWKTIYESEKNNLINILGKNILRIEHFGSTAIPYLEAKPTIDILIEIPNSQKIKNQIIPIMETDNYNYIPRKDCPPPYMMFVKGYSIDGIKEQTYHIHMAEKEHNGLWDRIYFRNYLIDNNEVAKEYEKLKKILAKKFKYDREAYTEGKTEFILEKTKIAKEYYT